VQCARHPKVETALSCGRCDKPICPACCVPGPVGMRCRDCAAVRSSVLYQVHPARFALAAVTGLAAATVVGFVLDWATGFFIYIFLFVGPIVGRVMGDIILRTTGNKRGLKLEILAGVVVVLGAVLSELISGNWRYLFRNIAEGVVYCVAVGITAYAAVARIRNT
jgi:hypothetical protein